MMSPKVTNNTNNTYLKLGCSRTCETPLYILIKAVLANGKIKSTSEAIRIVMMILKQQASAQTTCMIQYVQFIQQVKFEMNVAHRCHFHPQNTITKFCSNSQCTLPLCFNCETIHLQQHEEHHTKPNLIKFSEAYSRATDTLDNYLRSMSKVITDTSSRIQADKASVLSFINNYYNGFDKVKGKYNDIQDKLNKLKKGSIKTLIHFFSGDIDTNIQQYQFQSLFEKVKNLESKISTLSTHVSYDQKVQIPYRPRTYEPKYEKLAQPDKKFDYFGDQISKTQQTKQKAAQTSNIFQKIEEIKVSDRHRQRTRRSIFQADSKRLTQINSIHEDRQYNPSLTKHQLTSHASAHELPAPSPKFQHEKSKQINKFSLNSLPQENQQPLSFQNRYKITQPSASEQYENYKRQRQQKLSKQLTSYTREQNKQNKTMTASNQEQSQKYSQTLTKNYSQKVRSMSQVALTQNTTNHRQYDLKKQVLSPEQIRKMLQKRIQQRSKNILQIRQDQNAKEELHQRGRTWQSKTKQSIINQIYQ